MRLLDLFGINKEVSPSDVVRNAPEIESKIEQTNKALQDILNENPDLVNNLQNNFFEFPDTVGNLVEPASLLQPTVKAPTAAILEPLINFLRSIIIFSFTCYDK